ncbi:hypothetical protein [Nitrospina gracilis]|uniref:hypothetical protein n=1 Tax=Nitrospina gracilis TaxID=35801 RepID=UPI001F18B129|nr:hypothetical protein [Nitrospina gracilis]MCF8720725.1 hypothetical protein [Nitrospina gracilis Nb-211]
MWVKKAFRDYYKPKLKRELKRDPTPEECDQRFEEIYQQINLTLLVGVYEGVSIYFYEIAKFTLEEFNGFRDNCEEYLFERFGGGNYKLNFYEGTSFIVTVNFKIKGESKWEHLLPENAKS